MLVLLLGSSAEAGVLAAVLRLVMAGALGMAALRIAMAPQISRLLATGQLAEAERVHQAANAWIVLLSWPPYLLMALWPEHTLVLFGSEFASGAPALTLLALTALLNCATGNVGTVLLMSGRSGANAAIAVASLALQIGGALALAPFWGAFAVVAAKGASVVLENTAMTLLVSRRTHVATLGRPVRFAAFAAFVCFALPAGAARLLGVPPRGSVGLAVALGIALLGALTYASVLILKKQDLHLSALVSTARTALRRRRPVPTRPAPDAHLHAPAPRPAPRRPLRPQGPLPTPPQARRARRRPAIRARHIVGARTP
jgi:O-antigen/teichoic acid export membrane protein